MHATTTPAHQGHTGAGRANGRRGRLRARLGTAAVAVVLVAGASGCSRDLGTVEATVFADVNGHGLVVACEWRDRPVAGWIIRPGQTAREPLAAPPGSVACPRAVNDAGVVVGSAGDRAYRWDTVGGGHGELPGVDGAVRSDALDINAQGTVVGRSDTDTGTGSVPVRWDADGTVVQLLDGTGAPATGAARSINAAGAVVGTTGSLVVMWEPGATTATRFVGVNGAGVEDLPFGDGGRVAYSGAVKSSSGIAFVTMLVSATGESTTLSTPGWVSFRARAFDGPASLVGTASATAGGPAVPVRYSIDQGTLVPLADAPEAPAIVLNANQDGVVLVRTNEADGTHRLVELS